MSLRAAQDAPWATLAAAYAESRRVALEALQVAYGARQLLIEGNNASRQRPLGDVGAVCKGPLRPQAASSYALGGRGHFGQRP